MARRHDYPIIRLLITMSYVASALLLVGGLAAGAYLWIRAEALRDGLLLGGPLSDALHGYQPAQLCLGAAMTAGGGLVGFLLLGACAQVLAMQRDRAVNSALQVELLEDMLELNEEAMHVPWESRVELCEGCKRLASLRRIDSGQWVCRDCRQQIRSAS